MSQMAHLATAPAHVLVLALALAHAIFVNAVQFLPTSEFAIAPLDDKDIGTGSGSRGHSKHQISHQGSLGLTAYVQFGKTGSSSFRSLFEARAVRKGWPVLDPDDICEKHGLRVTSKACHYRKMVQCNRTAGGRKGEVSCGKRLCSEQAVFYKPEDLHCDSQPAGSIVQVAYPGFCEAMQGKRPCNYLTVLREPIARIVSAYNYWCLDCKDHVQGVGIYCQEQMDCPNLTILEWARRHDNEYTRRFAIRPGMQTNAGQYSNQGQAAHHIITDEDFHVALARLQSKDMLALKIEELSTPTDGPTGFAHLAHHVGDAQGDFFTESSSLKHEGTAPNHSAPLRHLNAREYSYTPTGHELEELKEIMKYDIRLYAAIGTSA